METPFKYLGMLVGECHKRGMSWDKMVSRIKSRLGNWKGKFISMVGRIYLIKSVLSSIPLFHLSLFRLPSIVLKKIVSLQRNFLGDKALKGGRLHGIKFTCLGMRAILTL